MKTNIKQLTVRALAALMITAAAVVPVSAQKKSVDLTGRESMGFNALDYVLQKPAENPTFTKEEGGFFKHLYISINAGASIIGNDFGEKVEAGFQYGGQVGGWFTPVHGLRIGADYGRSSIHKGSEDSWFIGGRVEYMFNATTLLRGYKPNRFFDLIGCMGVEYRHILKNVETPNGNNYGFSAAIQMHFNVTPYLFINLEPRLAMLTGTRYDNYNYEHYRMHADASINLGLGYRFNH